MNLIINQFTLIRLTEGSHTVSDNLEHKKKKHENWKKQGGNHDLHLKTER